MGSFLCVSTDCPCAFTEAERLDTRLLGKYTTDSSRKLLPNSKGRYYVASAIDTVVYTVQNGVTTSVKTDRVTKILAVFYAVHSTAATSGRAESEATATKVPTGIGAAVNDSRGADSVRKDDKKISVKNS